MDSKLQQGTAILLDANAKIDNAMEIGEGILQNLNENREKIHKIRENAVELDSNLTFTKRILRNMNRREIQNKIAVSVFSLVILSIIVVLIYYISKSKKSEE